MSDWMDKYARRNAAVKMGLIKDPEGLNLPDDLVEQERKRLPGEPFVFSYTNYRGETTDRRAIPATVYWGSTEYHPEPQWLLSAFDLDKWALRVFALSDVRPL